MREPRPSTPTNTWMRREMKKKPNCRLNYPDLVLWKRKEKNYCRFLFLINHHCVNKNQFDGLNERVSERARAQSNQRDWDTLGTAVPWVWRQQQLNYIDYNKTDKICIKTNLWSNLLSDDARVLVGWLLFYLFMHLNNIQEIDYIASANWPFKYRRHR